MLAGKGSRDRLGGTNVAGRGRDRVKPGQTIGGGRAETGGRGGPRPVNGCEASRGRGAGGAGRCNRCELVEVIEAGSEWGARQAGPGRGGQGRPGKRSGRAGRVVGGGRREGTGSGRDRRSRWAMDKRSRRAEAGDRSEGRGDREGPGRVVGAGRERRSVHAGEATRGASVGCRQRRRWRQRSGRRERGRGSAEQGRGERQDGVRVYCCPSGVAGAES